MPVIDIRIGGVDYPLKPEEYVLQVILITFKK